MENLLDSAVKLAGLLSPRKIEALADQIQSLSTNQVANESFRMITTPQARATLQRLLRNWKYSGCSRDVLVGVLRGAYYTRHQMLQEQNIELVWTGPTTPFVATRRTEQVMLDLIRYAQSEIFIVSFVAYDVSSVIKELNLAIFRDVDVRILLETSIEYGGSLSTNSVAIMKKNVPSAVMYAWTGKLETFKEGRVHAKVVVVDEMTAFFTSANLTSYALEKNMEAGIIINGGHIPSIFRSHLQFLIETNVICEIQ